MASSGGPSKIYHRKKQHLRKFVFFAPLMAKREMYNIGAADIDVYYIYTVHSQEKTGKTDRVTL